MSKLQKKTSALRRGHLTLQNMNFYKFFSTFVGHFCPPGSGSGSTGPIESGSGSETLRNTAKNQIVCVKCGENCWVSEESNVKELVCTIPVVGDRSVQLSPELAVTPCFLIGKLHSRWRMIEYYKPISRDFTSKLPLNLNLRNHLFLKSFFILYFTIELRFVSAKAIGDCFAFDEM